MESEEEKSKEGWPNTCYHKDSSERICSVDFFVGSFLLDYVNVHCLL